MSAPGAHRAAQQRGWLGTRMGKSLENPPKLHHPHGEEKTEAGLKLQLAQE